MINFTLNYLNYLNYLKILMNFDIIKIKTEYNAKDGNQEN